jgi:ubiquinone/menaquinone biosynthesis C-methylase UbiE
MFILEGDTIMEDINYVIEQAKESESKLNNKLATIQVGDARNLDFEDQSFDLVLMMGPLYHLVNKQDRMKALAEAHRVLKKDG